MRACETSRKLRGIRLLLVLAAMGVTFAPGAIAAQEPAHGAQPAPDSAQQAVEEAESHGAAGEHAGASPWDLAGKLVNFGLLAAGLVYLLRRPMATYLDERSVQVRRDLEDASRMKDEATRQIAEIEAKLAQLPTELESLRARGHDEIAAEEARINEAAEAERTRLLEQTRREIDLQLRIARRDLVTHAADLSIQVARDRIRQQITDVDQQRLVDRYLDQVRTHE
jgi:F-type H+-transporting ATPase subunit b